tara:strand:- start:2290 stop:2472 length:183 start_codon:yes stop_codon:yes gene_type:complete
MFRKWERLTPTVRARAQTIAAAKVAIEISFRVSRSSTAAPIEALEAKQPVSPFTPAPYAR